MEEHKISGTLEPSVTLLEDKLEGIVQKYQRRIEELFPSLSSEAPTIEWTTQDSEYVIVLSEIDYYAGMPGRKVHIIAILKENSILVDENFTIKEEMIADLEDLYM